jgi:recombination DNA repair RAD52 pathway protein
MADNNQNVSVQISSAELSLVENNALTAAQLKQLLKKTPSSYIHSRPAKGGGTWEYVTGGYIRKVLNLMFGWQWSFEIIDEKILHGEAIVKGKLTCVSNGITIVKMQYGNKDIICKKGSDIPLSIGNDLKAAATDALKKCAAELGIAADIYNKLDFKEVNVIPTETIDIFDLRELYNLKMDSLSVSEMRDAERILDKNETNSFNKLHKFLSSK